MRFDANRPAIDQLEDLDKNVGMAPTPPLEQAIANLYRLATDITGELEAKANGLADLFGLGVGDSVRRNIVDVANGAMDARALLFRHRRDVDTTVNTLREALGSAEEKVGELAIIVAGADTVAADEHEPGTRDAVLELLTALENLADLGGGRSDGNRLARQAIDRFAAWAESRPGKRLRVTWAPTVVTEALADLIEARDADGGARAQALADAGITNTTLQVAIDALRMADGTDEPAPAADGDARNLLVDDDEMGVAELPTPTDHRLDGRAFAEGVALETIRTGELVSIVTLPADAGDDRPTPRAFARRARQ